MVRFAKYKLKVAKQMLTGFHWEKTKYCVIASLSRAYLILYNIYYINIILEC